MKKKNLLIAGTLVFGIISCGESSDTTDESTTNDSTHSELVIEDELNEGTETIVEDLENEAFASKLSEVKGLLIDVRTAEEFNQGHIDGAVNMDYNSGAFENYIDSLDTTEPVFVYCQAGGRSGKARDILKDRNFSEVYNLKNGYGNWDQ